MNTDYYVWVRGKGRWGWAHSQGKDFHKVKESLDRLQKNDPHSIYEVRSKLHGFKCEAPVTHLPVEEPMRLLGYVGYAGKKPTWITQGWDPLGDCEGRVCLAGLIGYAGVPATRVKEAIAAARKASPSTAGWVTAYPDGQELTRFKPPYTLRFLRSFMNARGFFPSGVAPGLNELLKDVPVARREEFYSRASTEKDYFNRLLDHLIRLNGGKTEVVYTPWVDPEPVAVPEEKAVPGGSWVILYAPTYSQTNKLQDVVSGFWFSQAAKHPHIKGKKGTKTPYAFFDSFEDAQAAGEAALKAYNLAKVKPAQWKDVQGLIVDFSSFN